MYAIRRKCGILRIKILFANKLLLIYKKSLFSITYHQRQSNTLFIEVSGGDRLFFNLSPHLSPITAKALLSSHFCKDNLNNYDLESHFFLFFTGAITNLVCSSLISHKSNLSCIYTYMMTKRMSSLFGHENSSLDSPSITISNKQREHCNSAFDNRSTFSICAKLGQFSFIKLSLSTEHSKSRFIRQEREQVRLLITIIF